MACVKVVPVVDSFPCCSCVFLPSGSWESWSHSPGEWVVPGQQCGGVMAEGKGEEEGLRYNCKKEIMVLS